MKLSSDNADLFFRLMMPLLAFVNRRLGLMPEITNAADFEKNVGFEDKAAVREALYENIHLIDSFIDENPEDLPMNELAIVSNWKNFIKGDFFIERYLKKYAVFIDEDNKVYAVLSLRDALSEFFPSYALPLRVQAVLLPFRDEIVYDGFIAPYNVFFGSGIAEDLKHIYLKAKKRENIVFSLSPQAVDTKKVKIAKPEKDWKPEIRELIEKAAKLRGGGGQSELLSPTFSLIKSALELADIATEINVDQNKAYKTLEKIRRQLNKVETEFYYFDE